MAVAQMRQHIGPHLRIVVLAEAPDRPAEPVNRLGVSPGLMAGVAEGVHHARSGPLVCISKPGAESRSAKLQRQLVPTVECLKPAEIGQPAGGFSRPDRARQLQRMPGLSKRTLFVSRRPPDLREIDADP